MCLQSLVGLRHCSYAYPDALYFLNDLPGINMNMIAGVKEKEDDLVDNFELMKNRAFTQMQHFARKEMSKRYKLKTVSETYQLTTKINPAIYTPDSVTLSYRGLVIAIGKGAFNKIHVKDIKIYSYVTQTTDLNVFDVEGQMNVIETQSIDLVPGWNTITFNKSYSQSSIFIGYDATDFDSVQLLINDIGDCGCDWLCLGCNLSVKGGSYATSLVTSNNGYGMSGTFSMVCDYSKVLCNYTDVFADLFNWFVGIEFMKERLVSDRLNRWTTIDADKANQWLAIYEDAKKSELKEAFANIELNNDCCVECNPKITTSTWLG